MIGAVVFRSRAIDSGGAATRSLQAGVSYGHGIQILHNYALWPYEAEAETELGTISKLSFRDGRKEWKASLKAEQNHGSGEVVELLMCHSGQAANEELRTKVVFNTGHADTITLSVRVNET